MMRQVVMSWQFSHAMSAPDIRAKLQLNFLHLFLEPLSLEEL